MTSEDNKTMMEKASDMVTAAKEKIMPSKEGPAEEKGRKAGEKVDEVADSAHAKGEEMEDKTKEKKEEVKSSMQDTADKIHDKGEEMEDKTKEKADEAREFVHEKTKSSEEKEAEKPIGQKLDENTPDSAAEAGHEAGKKLDESYEKAKAVFEQESQ